MSAACTAGRWTARQKPEHEGLEDPEWEVLDEDGYFVFVACAGQDGATEANARLAAAAKDLLHACKYVIQARDDGDEEMAVRLATAAVAKATSP